MEDAPGVDDVKLAERRDVVGIKRGPRLYGPLRVLGVVAAFEFLGATD